MVINYTSQEKTCRQIQDPDFVQGIQYLINQNIITIPYIQSNSGQFKIPIWIKTNAGWWADGLITDEEFIDGIQYLVSNGIMKI